MSTDTTNEQLDDENTLHEQLKKIKEEHEEEVLEDSSEPSENEEDMNNPVHEYCS
ncbi:MAG: hypothetical protein JXQ67_04585 [Campylobacterales bacterium]|nr:hypothetical protein [Campylobacterales bacterium]